MGFTDRFHSVDFETFSKEIWKTAKQVRNVEIAMNEKFTTIIFQKKGEYLLPRASIIFSVFRKTHNTLSNNHCLNVRHSQTAFFLPFFLASAVKKNQEKITVLPLPWRTILHSGCCYHFAREQCF